MRLPDSWTGPYWEPRDAWVGVFWTHETRLREGREILRFLSVYICVLPCFPIRLRWYS